LFGVDQPAFCSPLQRCFHRIRHYGLEKSPTAAPMVHLFDEPQFNLQDGYIGFMLDFFRKLRAEGRLVVLCLHPTAAWHLEILAEIAEQFLLVSDGGVTQQANFATLAGEARFRSYLGPEMTRAAEALCSERAARHS
jgi:ABC-2 type transport system ATP-binding protein